MAQSGDHAAADAGRNAATDYLRSDRWADVLALEPALRADREYWFSLWAPACAIARSASPRSQLAGRDCPPGRGAAYARSAAVACDGRERYSALTGESMMGIFSWLSRWREDPSAGRQTLIFRNDEDDPEFDEIRRAAAADVAAVEQDDKFFGRNPPADQDEGL